MLYYDFEADNTAYKLRLNIRNIVSLEKTLGCNPLMVFGTGDRVPTVTEMVAILHHSLQAYHHGITMDATFNIFESFLNDGNDLTAFIPVIIGVYRVSGIMKPEAEHNPENEENAEKN